MLQKSSKKVTSYKQGSFTLGQKTVWARQQRGCPSRRSRAALLAAGQEKTMVAFHHKFTMTFVLHGWQYDRLLKFLYDGSNWVDFPEENPEPPEDIKDKATWKYVHRKPAVAGEFMRVLREEPSHHNMINVVVGIRTELGYDRGVKPIPTSYLTKLLETLALMKS